MTMGNSKLWQLYDALIEPIDETIRVEAVVCGHLRVMVRSSAGNSGLASLLSGARHAEEGLWPQEQYQGKRLRDVAALAKSWNALEASVGMAAINAYYNVEHDVARHGALLFAGDAPGGDCFCHLQSAAMGKRVATIGHFRQAGNVLAGVCDLTVFEREPKEGDLPDAAEEYLLPEMELVFITGMALTNKTMPRLLQLAQGAEIVLSGPSVPLTPILADFGVCMLAGLVVSDASACEKAISGQGFLHMFASGKKVLMEIRGKAGYNNEADV